MEKQKELMYWVMGIFVVWMFGSAYIYTCSIKGFCDDKNKSNIKIVKEDINERFLDENYVENYNNDNNYNNTYIALESKTNDGSLVEENKIIKNIETTKEYKRRTIKCYTHINSIIKINSDKNIKSEVIKLENFFNDYYNKDLVVDGFFGDMELEAVKEFQLNKNLEVDGVVGPKTLEIINAVYCVKNEKE